MTPVPQKAPIEGVPADLLLRQISGCIWLLRRGGSFHYIYGDAARVFGRAHADLDRRDFISLCEPSARASWAARLERVFAGDTAVGETRFAEHSPAFSITLFPVRLEQGEVAFAGGIARQIPEADVVMRALETLESGRARLSEVLHGRIGQDLSAAGLQLDLLRMDLADSGVPIPRRIAEIQAALGTVIEVVRDLNRELNPVIAERVGLRAALERLAGLLRDGFPGNVRVLADASAQPPPPVAAALYRIAQEAAGQAARRPGCSAIEILLKSLRSGPALEIRDNAPFSGVVEGDRSGGLDAMMMRFFADRAGIELQIDRTPENGTLVRALCRI